MTFGAALHSDESDRSVTPSGRDIVGSIALD